MTNNMFLYVNEDCRIFIRVILFVCDIIRLIADVKNTMIW